MHSLERMERMECIEATDSPQSRDSRDVTGSMDSSLSSMYDVVSDIVRTPGGSNNETEVTTNMHSEASCSVL